MALLAVLWGVLEVLARVLIPEALFLKFSREVLVRFS